jgi:hypothetical protein
VPKIGFGTRRHGEADVATRTETEFHRELVAGSDRLKKDIGYNPTRFLQMVAEHGGPGAVHQLLKGQGGSDGFTTLWEAGRLDMSVEAMVLLPWYQELFTADEQDVARRRLTEYGFDIETFVQTRSATPPGWSQVAP